MKWCSTVHSESNPERLDEFSEAELLAVDLGVGGQLRQPLRRALRLGALEPIPVDIVLRKQRNSNLHTSDPPSSGPVASPNSSAEICAIHAPPSKQDAGEPPAVQARQKSFGLSPSAVADRRRLAGILLESLRGAGEAAYAGTMRPQAILSVERLCKSYGAVRAVDGVTFHVAPGEIVGLLGPNGAGKTTTINMILGVLAPTAGRIEIDGVDLDAPAQPGPRQDQLRRRLRAPARQPDRRAEPARVRHDLRRSSA